MTFSSLFDPEISVNSGQVFLWEKINNSWYGIDRDHVLKFTLIDFDGMRNYKKNIAGDAIEFYSFPEISSWEQKLFRLDDDIHEILSRISSDELIAKLVKKYPGLRLIRQDPEQCILSFVCASNTSIVMIRRMLRNLSRKFGTKLLVDGKEFFTFPTAQRISKASIDELRSCSLGYRAKILKSVAAAISTKTLDIELLAKSSYSEAKQELLKVNGIGHKIADCALLFSLEKLDAFPIDVWITRTLLMQYRWLFNIYLTKKQLGDKIGPSRYKLMSERARKHFGKYAGYAQQYLYFDIRESSGQKW